MTTKNYVVGIDIGGTNTALGLVDEEGGIIFTDSFVTNTFAEDIDAYVAELAKRIRLAIQQTSLAGQVCGVGVGVPNGNYFDGTVGFAVNLPWRQQVPLAKMLSDRINLPVTLNNDANAATIGEMIYGAARGMRNFIVITLGTGLGSGIVVDGNLIYGSNGYAGELGHIIVERDGRLCGCGRHGCLETYVSATGVARTARIYLSKYHTQPSSLRDLDPRNITSKEVFLAAKSGDPIATQVFEDTGALLGRALANFVHFSAPEAIVLFGGLTKAGNILMEPTRKAFRENLLSIYDVKLLTSLLREGDAAILGAAAIAWEKLRQTRMQAACTCTPEKESTQAPNPPRTASAETEAPRRTARSARHPA